MPPITFNVFAYISAVPSPIGVGETALVTFRIDQPLMGALERIGHANGTTVTITKPDGTTENKGPFSLDSTSSGWMTYTPTQAGTYYFQFHFPQQGPYWVNTTFPTNTQTLVTYLADDSEKVPLVVQQQPIQGYDKSPPLPTGYWTRPINAENKGWWQMADNWLLPAYDRTSRSFAGSTAFAPYTSGPQSAHILYAKPIVPGGLAGGRLGDISYYTGISYEQYFDPLVLQGTVLYAEHGPTSSAPSYGTRFFNLYTGEDYPLMYFNNTGVSFALVINIDTPNEHGALPYLVVSSGDNWLWYEMLPNMQGPPRLRFTLSGMTGLTNPSAVAFGPNGEYLSWTMGGDATSKWIAMFNSTRAVLGPGYLTPGSIATWSPSGTVNASRRLNEGSGAVPTAELAAAESRSHSKIMGIEYNVTVPRVPGVDNIIGTSFAVAGTGLVNYEEGLLLTGFVDSTRFPLVYADVGYDIGQILKSRTPDGTYPASITHLFAKNNTMIHDIHNRYSANLLDGTYVRYDEGEEVYYAFDARTGAVKWQTTPINNAWAVFTRQYHIAYGKVVTCGFDGHVRCFSLTNGALVWDYYKGSAGFENAYGTYPEYAGFTIADNTVYTTADEHSSDGVLWRGANLWAINMDTGNLTWKVNGMYRHPVVADGILIALNSYDGQVYAFGKGPSKTTVSAPQTAVPKGTAVMLTGSVTDQSPGSKDTPAISDDSMSAWMEYLYMQKVLPANAKGVPVKLTAVDPNGNTQEIGTVTSDASGNFGFAWTPPVEGTYKVMATFAGSNSYDSSSSTAYFVVSPAAAAAPQPTSAPTAAPTAPPTVAPTVAPTVTPTVSPTVAPPPEAQPSTDIYIIAAAVVIVVVVVAVAAVFLRKRK
ncbi:MAG: PQQ-binding-like beta-propeller repeat protein [Candidatus Bathyarchaeia archaeon]